MRDLLHQVRRLRAAGPRAVIATLVAARGIGARAPGTKMWIDAEGRVLGAVTLGGCVEPRIADAAEEVLASGAPRLVRVDLSEEDAYDLGLTCAGAIEVWLEPVRFDRADDAVLSAYEIARRRVEGGGRAAIAWRLDGAPGRLVLTDDGAATGSLGDAALDGDVARRAAALMPRRTPTLARPTAATIDTSVFIDVLAPPRRLVVFGAGPVTAPLIRFAAELGFHTVLVDPRRRTPSLEDGPATDEIQYGRGDVAASQLHFDADTSAILLAHDYKIDLPVLTRLLGTDAGYIGVLGSRRRGEALLRFLREAGVSDEALARVRVPVGLEIGAESPEEVALSILAEIVALRTGAPGEEES